MSKHDFPALIERLVPPTGTVTHPCRGWVHVEDTFPGRDERLILAFNASAEGSGEGMWDVFVIRPGDHSFAAWSRRLKPFDVADPDMPARLAEFLADPLPLFLRQVA